jgi:hypothetical protein
MNQFLGIDFWAPLTFTNRGSVCDRVYPFGFLSMTQEKAYRLCVLPTGASLVLKFFSPKTGYFVDFLYILLISHGGNYTEKGGGGGRSA